MRGIVLTILFSLPALLSSISLAADHAVDEPPHHATASLHLRLESPGKVEIGFYLFPPPKEDVGPIRKALKESLGCDELKVSSIDSDDDGWTLNARCMGAMPRKGSLAEGTVHLSALLREVRSGDVDVLGLSIFHIGAVPFNSAGATGYAVRVGSPRLRRFQIPTSASPPPIIHLQFGYTRRDLARMFLPLLLLLILPIVLTLAMRRAVLRKPDARRSGAWFGYWRFLQWNTLGSFVLWVTATIVLKVNPFLEFVLGTNLYGMGTDLEILCLSIVSFLPPIPVSIFCTVLSHRVFVEVQGAEWSRREVFRQAVLSQMATLVPIVMAIQGLSIISLSNPALGALTLLAAFFVMVLSARRLQKITNREPHALTTGELRDRAFALAEKAGVKLKQLYVLPTPKARMANALARRGYSILFTDYLLEHLSKREVDAILAHELAHLKRRHPGLLLLALIAGMTAAGVLTGHLDSLFPSLPEGSLFPVTILAGLLAFFLVARRFERRADAAAVLLTNDPEALIHALTKITTLNRLPIHWGKLQGKLLTHPSTLQRVQGIARKAGIAEEHLARILTSPEDPCDHYSFPPTASHERKAFSTSFKTNLSFRLAWSLIAASTLTPALVAFVTTRVHLPVPLWSVLASGFLATALLTLWISNVGPTWGGLMLKRRTLERMKSQGFAPDTRGGIFVGFSPDPYPRLYEMNFIWDVGFLIPVGDRLFYLGEEVRFVLRRDQITSIRLGPGHPSWWPTQRAYIAWKDEEKSATRTLNLVPADSPSVRKLYVETAAFQEKLQAWHRGSSLCTGLPSQLESLGSPVIGAVTSLSPRQHGTARSYLTNSLFTGLIALLVGSLFGLWGSPLGWGVFYTVFVALSVAIGTRLPYSFYRDRPA